MSWVQLGLVYVPDGRWAWSQTHAQAPSAIVLRDVIRVYYATRDRDNRSRPSFVEVDRDDPRRVIRVYDRPVMDLGEPGTHDEDGVLASHLVQQDGELWMYYGGVSRGGTVPYRMSIGLARSQDGGLTFDRVFKGPVVDRTPDEPYMTMAPYVLRFRSEWRMWYGSGIRWVDVEGKYEPVYAIKMAHSIDGMRWRQTNHLCIEPSNEFEANTRPSVMMRDDGYEMWFSYRQSRDYRDGSGSYRIGYAASTDGVKWTRLEDPTDLRPTGSGWNSVTMSYPNVVAVDGRQIMFHNGDGFGRSGFGCSIWKQD